MALLEVEDFAQIRGLVRKNGRNHPGMSFWNGSTLQNLKNRRFHKKSSHRIHSVYSDENTTHNTSSVEYQC